MLSSFMQGACATQSPASLCVPKRACHSSMPARSALATRARTAARVGVSLSHGSAASVGAGASSKWQCSTAARGSPGCRAAPFDGRLGKPAERTHFLNRHVFSSMTSCTQSAAAAVLTIRHNEPPARCAPFWPAAVGAAKGCSHAGRLRAVHQGMAVQVCSLKL